MAACALVSGAVATTGRERLARFGCGAVVFVIIGEELAWGTRLIGSGVEFIESHNEQSDTTLHNLTGVLDVSFLGIVALAMLLAASLLLRWRPLQDASLTVVFWLLVPALYALYRVSEGEVPYRVAKLSEAAELVFALAVARLSLCSRPVDRAIDDY